MRWVALAITLAAPWAARAATLIAAQTISGAPAGAHAYLIHYRSVGYDGRANVLTGLLVEPDARAPDDGRPVVAWAHGTTGIAEGCAPSSAEAVRFAQIPALSAMIAHGWTIVAPDYAGLGSPGPHPYLVADATARAVLDSVRAARDHAPRATSARFALWGLSQGGHAALVGAERARAYAPNLTLVGTAAAAPPTDLAANFGARGKPTARGVLTAFVASSWARVYGAPLATLGRPGTVRLVQRMARVCALGQGMKLGTIVGALAIGQALKRVDVPATPPWRDLLRLNSAEPRRIAGPLLIAQASADEIVAPSVTETFARAVCRAGTRVRWLPVDGGDHAHTAERTAVPTVDWLKDRFAGRSAPSDCGRF